MIGTPAMAGLSKVKKTHVLEARSPGQPGRGSVAGV